MTKSQPDPVSAQVGGAVCDSDDYRHSFYGILNRQGEFWTPLAFNSSKAAETYLAKFVDTNPERFHQMLRTHKIVPVRVRLETIPAQAIEAQRAETGTGSVHESAVRKDAPGASHD